MNKPASHPGVAPPRLVADSAKPNVVVQKPQQASAGRPQTDTIGTFIALEIEARQCAELDSLRFAMTNATRKLAGFDEAFLAEPRVGGTWQVTCASGVHKIDRQAPLVQFMDAWLPKVREGAGAGLNEPKFFNLQSDSITFGLHSADVSLPYALWLPVKGRDGRMLCSLVLLKSEPWRPQTVSLLIPLASTYGHAWQALAPLSVSPAKHVARLFSKTRLALAVAAAAVLACFIPVPMSSLAPAEVVAREPAIVAAPIDGVISDMLVAPGAMVAKDEPLLMFSDVNLRNSAELAKRNKAVAQAKYFKAVQMATSQQKGIEDVAIAKAEFDVASGDLAYAEEMLARTEVKATRSGLVIYSSKSDWIGRPVKTGERVMEIGDPNETELRIEVPVSDALSLQEGGDVALFLDGDPLTAVKAHVTRTNYRPAPNGENQLVYRVHAAFADGQARRIGLRGVARVSTHDVPLGFYLFRRPISALRQRFGL